MRPVEAGSIQDVVSDVYDVFGGVRKASAATGLAPSVLSYGTEMREDRPGGLGVNYLDRMARMDPAAAAILASHFAALAGGVFQPIEVAVVEELTSACADAIKENGEAIFYALQAARSGRWEDAQIALPEVDDSITEMTGLRAILMQTIQTKGGR
ncbi:hypothetical protein [Thioclava sp. GXIMD2076]|uniref:hypothetical protein n=1 Tax=Thioclava sp. GXIMD2076 TaxID=3131931 RepID=UPI0030CE2943